MHYRKEIKSNCSTSFLAALPMSCKNIYDAVYECYKNSKAGDLVLLAPGCASTDQFKNFEEQGTCFSKGSLRGSLMKSRLKEA